MPANAPIWPIISTLTPRCSTRLPLFKLTRTVPRTACSRQFNQPTNQPQHETPLRPSHTQQSTSNPSTANAPPCPRRWGGARARRWSRAPLRPPSWDGSPRHRRRFLSWACCRRRTAHRRTDRWQDQRDKRRSPECITQRQSGWITGSEAAKAAAPDTTIPVIAHTSCLRLSYHGSASTKPRISRGLSADRL